MKVLISDKLSEAGLAIFKKSGKIEVLYQPGLGKDVAKLKEVIANVDALAVRSETKVTPEILACAKKLRVIGRAGIGVDNIDVAAASKSGVIVMNTPGGNVVTTAEHAISMMCSLTRSIPQATASLKAGKWEKNKFMGAELYQKILGVIGIGNIGKIVASRAQALKMNVIAFDPFLTDDIAAELGVKKVSLGELFKTADYITVHTPLNDKTRNLINAEAFKEMKKGVFIINCARGGIVNETDLLAALEADIVAGAALDVFEKEPVDPNHPLLKSDKIICTPHLGASTEEAQENVALEVATQIVDYLLNGNIVNALNTPSADADTLKKLGSVLPLAQKLGSLQGQLCSASPEQIHINYYGDLATFKTDTITTAILQGVLKHMLSDVAINAVNAPYLAKERGICIKETKITAHSDFASLIEVTLKFKNDQKVVAGTIFGKSHPRLVRFNDIYTEVNPSGQLLIIENMDRPGIVGKIGTLLGTHQVNISNMQLGLDEKTKMATAFYAVQGDVSADLIAKIKSMDGIVSVNLVDL